MLRELEKPVSATTESSAANRHHSARPAPLRTHSPSAPSPAMFGPPRKTLLAAVALVATLGAGCIADDGAYDDLTPTAKETHNAYTFNAYTFNAYTFNAYTFKGPLWADLTTNQLDAAHLPAGFLDELDDPTPIEHTDLTIGEYAEMTMRYLYSCAMDEGDTMDVVTPGGKAFTFEGELGVAPQWAVAPLQNDPSLNQTPGTMSRLVGLPPLARACDSDCQRWVSACVISRINAFGIAIPISLTGDNDALGRTSDETTTFDFQEGAFFGNILTDSPVLYSCSGTSWDSNIWRPILDAVPPYDYIDARLCGRENTSRCMVEYLGPCSDVCGQSPDGGYYDPCTTPDGISYPQVATTYLRHGDLIQRSADLARAPAAPHVTVEQVDCWRGTNTFTAHVAQGDDIGVSSWTRQYRIGGGVWRSLTSNTIKAGSLQRVSVRARACNSVGCSGYTTRSTTGPFCSSGGGIKPQ